MSNVLRVDTTLQHSESTRSDKNSYEDSHSPKDVDVDKKRQIISELLFYAARGSLSKCKKLSEMLKQLNVELSSKECCDYDKRTPLHLAASEGSYRVTEWLLQEKGVNPNVKDRFGRTALEDAMEGDHPLIVRLLMDYGAELSGDGGKTIDLAGSKLGSFLKLTILDSQEDSKKFLEDEFWEMDPSSITKEEIIGEGGFGTVYRGMWYNTPVAIKVLKQSDNLAVEEFITEMNLMRKLHHPHIVQFLGANTKVKPYFIVTDIATGGSLSDLFRAQVRLPFYRMIELAIDVARGMSYLHSHGIKRGRIMHRDLKPSNLMIFGNFYSRNRKDLLFDSGILKITDFGLSKTLYDFSNHNKHSGAYQLTGETGSYRFMAPEVFRHETYNHKVDVYAYAMILYQLFEGKVPFVYYDAIQAAKAASKMKMRPKFNVLKPSDKKGPHLRIIKEVIERCWSENPDERPDFEDLIPILQDCLAKALAIELNPPKRWPFGKKFNLK